MRDHPGGVGRGPRRTYAAMTSALDDNVGRVLAKLRDAGLEENTLVFFFIGSLGIVPAYMQTDLYLEAVETTRRLHVDDGRVTES